MNVPVDPQLRVHNTSDDAITAYFTRGYSYQVIVDMLANYEG